MKKIYLLICGFLSLHHNTVGQTKYAEIIFGEPLDFQQPQNPYIVGYGFNTSYSFYETSLNEYGNNVNDFYNNTLCSQFDDRYINTEFFPFFDKISVQNGTTTLRFPGGTLSNFYHLGNLSIDKCNSDNKGYGIKKNETYLNVPNFYNTWYPKDQSHTRNAVFDLIELIKGQNKQIEVIVVLNVLQHFINNNSNGTKRNGVNTIMTASDYNLKKEENLNLIRLLKYHNINIKAVEIGNELGWGEYTSIAPWDVDIEEYLEILKNYSNTIRTEFPEIKIGVTTSQTRYNVISNWNNSLSLNKQYFDAYVIHRYYLPNNEIDGSSSYNFVNTVFKTELNNFNNAYNSDKTKKIWLTEFNLAFENESNAINDIANASYIINFLSMLSLYNRDYNVVEYPIIHNLAMQSNKYPLINVKGNYNNSQPYCFANQSLFGAFVYNQLPIFNGFNYYPSSDISSFSIKNVSDNSIQSISKDEFYIKTIYGANNINNTGLTRFSNAYFVNLKDEPIKVSAKNIFIKIGDVIVSLFNSLNYGLLSYANINYVSDLESVSQLNTDINDFITTETFFDLFNFPSKFETVIPPNTIGIINVGFTCLGCKTNYRLNNSEEVINSFLISGNLKFNNINEPVTINIYNGNGQLTLCKSLNESTNEVDVSLFSKGIYFFTIAKNNTIVFSNKFIIN